MAAQKIRWGILSTANIGMQKVTPAIMASPSSEVVAIASRDAAKARAAADTLGIAKSYGTYEELFADPDIDAVYNPLPNHLHVPMTLAAARAGKHVLCEKPIALSSGEAEQLRDIPDNIVFMEAFMVRFHPQWHRIREIIRSGELGEIRSINAVFTYHNVDPGNVRNQADIGGAMLDIGRHIATLVGFVNRQRQLLFGFLLALFRLAAQCRQHRGHRRRCFRGGGCGSRRSGRGCRTRRRRLDEGPCRLCLARRLTALRPGVPCITQPLHE